MKKTKSPKHPDLDLFSPAKKRKRSLTVDEVAEALWIAENPWWTRGDPFGPAVEWLWRDADEMAKDEYRAKARTVIEHFGWEQ